MADKVIKACVRSIVAALVLICVVRLNFGAIAGSRREGTNTNHPTNRSLRIVPGLHHLESSFSIMLLNSQ